MRVRSILASTSCASRVEREGALMVKFKGKRAPIEQDEPFEEQKGTEGEAKSPILWHPQYWAEDACHL